MIEKYFLLMKWHEIYNSQVKSLNYVWKGNQSSESLWMHINEHQNDIILPLLILWILYKDYIWYVRVGDIYMYMWEELTTRILWMILWMIMWIGQCELGEK